MTVKEGERYGIFHYRCHNCGGYAAAKHNLSFSSAAKCAKGKKDAGLFFTVLERAGQIALIVLLAVSHDSLDGRALDVWVVLMVVCIAVYYGLWLRYFLKGRQYCMLYRPMLTLPVPMAVFPVFAFAFAGVWGKSLFLLAASAVFALGHIPNSLRKAKLFQ